MRKPGCTTILSAALASSSPNWDSAAHRSATSTATDTEFGDLQVVLGECYESLLSMKREGLCRAIGMSALPLQVLRRAISTCQLATPPDPDVVALLWSALAPIHNMTWPSGREAEWQAEV